ncbi:MAG: DNA cytosine methyltransferase [Hyphomonadaceae bacterium]
MASDSGAAFYEFFAGGGLARLGLAGRFACRFANDIDSAKASAYRAAFGDAQFRQGDVGALGAGDLPGRAALAWASFPCQDLSLAGARGGLDAPRSGAFWGFWRLIEALDAEGRAPPLIALENVCGLLTSREGRDFTALIGALAARGYRAGALEIDAAHFTPQSRPRLFIVAARDGLPASLAAPGPLAPFHSAGVIAAAARLPAPLRAHWIWWRLPAPPARNAVLADILEDPPEGAAWRTAAQTERLLAQMSPLHLSRVNGLRGAGGPHVGGVFRRIRIENGVRVQRAEARFDGLAGCLRTPAGGSSNQTLLFIEGAQTRSRLMTPREAARLMGAPDEFPLPAGRTAALHLLGDAVCVSAVRWLSDHLLGPLSQAHAPALSVA